MCLTLTVFVLFYVTNTFRIIQAILFQVRQFSTNVTKVQVLSFPWKSLPSDWAKILKQETEAGAFSTKPLVSSRQKLLTNSGISCEFASGQFLPILYRSFTFLVHFIVSLSAPLREARCLWLLWTAWRPRWLKCSAELRGEEKGGKIGGNSGWFSVFVLQVQPREHHDPRALRGDAVQGSRIRPGGKPGPPQALPVQPDLLQHPGKHSFYFYLKSISQNLMVHNS